MDSIHFRAARGAHTPAQAFKACVLGVWQASVVWPLLWLFVPPDEAEISVGRRLLTAAEEVLGEGRIQHLLIDRGYLDGAWLTTQAWHARVTMACAGILILEDMCNLSRAPGMIWQQQTRPIAYRPPQRHIWACQRWKPRASCETHSQLSDSRYLSRCARYYGLVTEPDIAAGGILRDGAGPSKSL